LGEVKNGAMWKIFEATQITFTSKSSKTGLLCVSLRAEKHTQSLFWARSKMEQCGKFSKRPRLLLLQKVPKLVFFVLVESANFCGSFWVSLGQLG